MSRWYAGERSLPTTAPGEAAERGGLEPQPRCDPGRCNWQLRAAPRRFIGNIVNIEYRQLFQDLTELRQQIADGDKLDAVVDIDTLTDQLAKRSPDTQVVERLWPRIEKAANLAGLGQVAASAAHAVGQLLS